MNRLDLYSRLRGFKREDTSRPARGKIVTSLNDKIGGEVVSRGSKSIIRVFRKIPYDSLHGTIRLGDLRIVDTGLLDVLFRGIGHPVSVKDLLFFDVETTGLSGGAGTVVFLIGFLNVGEEGLEFTQLFLNSLSSESLFLEHVQKEFAPDRCLVSYNGKSFDYNIIKNRFIMQGMRFGDECGMHLDLLYTSRRIWRNLLPDYSLGTVENRILDVKRASDIPGWRVPEVYSHFLRGRGVDDDMKMVFSHNRNDVLSLFALLIAQLRIVAQAGETAAADRTAGALRYDPVSVSRLFAAINRRKKAVDILSLHQEDAAALKSLALLYKRDGHFEQALEYFKRLSGRKGGLSDFIFACTEIAKIYEHRIGDFQQALSYTAMMRERLKRAGYFYLSAGERFESERFESELESVNRRYARLLQKIARTEQCRRTTNA